MHIIQRLRQQSPSLPSLRGPVCLRVLYILPNPGSISDLKKIIANLLQIQTEILVMNFWGNMQLATVTMVWTSGRLTRLLNWQCTLCPEVPGMMPIESIWVIGWFFVVGKHGDSEQGFWSQKKATFWQPLSHREEVQDWKSFDLASWRCHQSSFVFSV